MSRPAAEAGNLGSSELAEEADCEGRAWIHLPVCHTDEASQKMSANPDGRSKLDNMADIDIMLIVLPPRRQTRAQSQRRTWRWLTDTLESPSGTTHRSPGNHSVAERAMAQKRILLHYHLWIICLGGYLFASEPHENISHNALPLAPEHTFLKCVQQLEVLLDQKPQGGGKRTADAGEDDWYST